MLTNCLPKPFLCLSILFAALSLIQSSRLSNHDDKKEKSAGTAFTMPFSPLLFFSGSHISIGPKRIVGAFFEHGQHFKGIFMAESTIFNGNRWEMAVPIIDYRVDLVNASRHRVNSGDFVLWDTTLTTLSNTTKSKISEQDHQYAEKTCADPKPFQKNTTYLYLKIGETGHWDQIYRNRFFPTPLENSSEIGFLRLYHTTEPGYSNPLVECFPLEELHYVKFLFRTQQEPPLFWQQVNQTEPETLESYNGHLDKVRQQLVRLLDVHPLQILLEQLVNSSEDFPKAVHVNGTMMWQFKVGLKGNQKQLDTLKSITVEHAADGKIITQWPIEEGEKRSDQFSIVL
ncbi:hypothetical protein Ddc_13013 [Ditylenchus destructor]|nr:hypothetical protein Ddc_13013 [Ditylenchus destructor]